MALEFSQETLKNFNDIVARYPKKEAAMLPVLYLAQEEFGYLSSEVIDYVAGIMEIPSARLYGLATFYTMLRLKPIGKYHIQICHTLSCVLAGSERITDLLSKKLGIGVGETTSDGRFTLTEVECIASCGTGPVIQINEETYEGLSEKKVEEILQALR
ncbi:MAG: NADH-quinone oxidoreductase subunit NuoE [Candidatus Binatia bacterium]|jgi:NADH-quinone oxidoreductase subunit E|nr:NADH-quinone oxidoreductase subunit NuoE [Candidatus Binatia bacterium]